MSPVHKSANLCWGQRYIWLRHHQLPPHARHEAHIVITFELPEGSPLAGVRAMLNYLVRRHEALRTTYHFDDPADPQPQSRPREPRQRVHPPAALPVVTASTERDGTPSPAEVIEELSTREFDLAQEWPIRACVITSGGAPKQAVVVLNHMAFDAWTVDQFERELVALRTGATSGRPAILEPIRYQPVDLAQYEASTGAIAIKDRSLAYWRDEIAQLPADTFAARRTAGTPGTAPATAAGPTGSTTAARATGEAGATARAATLTSPAMLEATRRIAPRHNTWPSLIHLTAYSMVMAAYTGSGRVAHLSFTGNRGSGSYSDVMTCMFSPLLMQVECGDDPTFSELLRRTIQRFEEGQRYANVPYDELVELVSREGVRRGHVVRTGSELNFLSHASHAARARRTTFAWNAAPTAWAEYGSDTYFRIFEMQDAVVLGLNAVATVMDADAIEKFLRGYEQLVLAQQEPTADLRVSDVARLIGFGGAPERGQPGEPAGLTEPAAGAATALAAAVAEVNGLAEVDAGQPYVVAGGRVLLIPGVLAKLRDAGWEGITVYQLASPQSLAAVSRLLTRTVVPATSAV